MKVINIVLVLLLFLLVPCCLSQLLCGEVPTDHTCYQYLNYTEAYLPNGYEINDIVSYIAPNISAMAYIPDSGCREYAIKILCLNSFANCNPYVLPPTNTEIYLPSRPCRSTCDEFVEKCTDYMSFIMPGFSCHTVSTTDGNLNYPAEYTDYNLTSYGGAADIPVHCAPGTSDTVYSQTLCKGPLVYRSAEDVEGKGVYYQAIGDCYIPCGLNIWTEKQARAKKIVEPILYYISLASGFYFLITFGLLPNQLNHKMIIICYAATTLIFLSLSYVVQESVQPNFACNNEPARYVTSVNSSMCMLCGIFFQIGALGTILFMFFYSFDFYMTMTMRKFKYFKHMSVFLWFITLLLSFLPAKHFSSTISTTGCWINYSEKYWQYFCFYVPVYIAVAFMIYFVGHSTYKVYGMTKITSYLGDKRILLLNLRSVIFLIIILFTITFTSMYPLYVTYNSGDYNAPIEKWVVCLYSASDPSTCPTPVLPHFDLRFLNVITLSINGLVGIFGFGIDPMVFSIYRESRRLKFILFKLRHPLTPYTVSFNNASTTDSGNTPAKSARKSRSVSMKSLNSSGLNQSLASTASNDTEENVKDAEISEQ